MAAFETPGGDGKMCCHPDASRFWHLLSSLPEHLRKKMKETSRKQSILVKLKLKQSFCIVTRLADIHACADEHCGKDTMEMIFSNLLKAWPKFPADVGCCNAREVDVLSHRHCVLQVL